jgi:hypothetical protein
MIQDRDYPWQQSCPLPPLTTPVETPAIVPPDEGAAATPAQTVAAQLISETPTLLLDDYQWMALL